MYVILLLVPEYLPFLSDIRPKLYCTITQNVQKVCPYGFALLFFQKRCRNMAWRAGGGRGKGEEEQILPHPCPETSQNNSKRNNASPIQIVIQTDILSTNKTLANKLKMQSEWVHNMGNDMWNFKTKPSPPPPPPHTHTNTHKFFQNTQNFLRLYPVMLVLTPI